MPLRKGDGIVLDLSGIIKDKVDAMENDGAIKAYIEATIERTVKDVLDDVLDGYQLKKALREKLSEGLNDIVNSIGLEGYNTFIAEAVRKMVTARLEGDATEKIRDAIEGALLMKRENIKLSEILSEYRSLMNEIDDNDDKNRLNEEEGGFTCSVRKKENSYNSGFSYYNLYFDDEGFKESEDRDDYAVVVEFSGIWSKYLSNEVKIKEVYFRGERLSRQFIPHLPDRFETLILNLYFNQTPVIVDLENCDEEDHYYEVDEY